MISTRGMRWVQYTYMAYEASTRHLPGVQGSYKGYKAATKGARQLQLLQGSNEVATRAAG